MHVIRRVCQFSAQTFFSVSISILKGLIISGSVSFTSSLIVDVVQFMYNSPGQNIFKG